MLTCFDAVHLHSQPSTSLTPPFRHTCSISIDILLTISTISMRISLNPYPFSMIMGHSVRPVFELQQEIYSPWELIQSNWTTRR